MTSLDPRTLFAIIPGAWHPSEIYDPLVSQIQKAGYNAVVIPYPSTNSSSPTTATCAEDAEAVHRQFISLVEDEGKSLVVMSHSYGGIPAAGAAYGLSVRARAQEGKGGGILGLVYISAFVVSEGTSLLTFIGRKHAPFLVPDTVSSSSLLDEIGGFSLLIQVPCIHLNVTIAALERFIAMLTTH